MNVGKTPPDDFKPNTMNNGLKMGILLEMVPPNITEALMARLPDKNAKDENGKEIAKYPITKEILVQYIEAKTDFGGPMPMDCGHLDFHDERDGDGSNGSNNGEVHALGKGFGRKGSGFGGKGGGGAPFSGQCNACGEYGHKSAHCPQKWACWTCGDLSHRAAQCPNNIVKGKSKGVDHMTGGKGQQVVKGKGKKGQQVSPWNKGKGQTGKGVYQSYGLWDMEEGQQEDVTSQGWPLGALTLFNLNEDFPKWRQVPKKASKKVNHAEGFNVSRPTTDGTLQPRSGEPMRVDPLDLINKQFASPSILIALNC